MLVLETNNLSKKYKGYYAVNSVNLHIEEGDIYGFVGENGAGKTTVIRLITGLAYPTSGTFSLFGVSNTSKDFDNVRNKIGGIVEAPSINKSLTALENLKIQNLITNSKKTDEELIELIKLVGLNYDEIKLRKAKNFSLGMRQRLGIAIVMVSNPKFIILDEPMNGLDPQGFIEVREIIQKLAQQGITFLISSHILAELDKICNKVGIISRGHLVEELTIEQLHNKSRRKLVITFINDDINKFISLSNIKDYEMNDKELVIYDNLSVNEIMIILVKENISVSSINCMSDTIEDYYISVMKKVTNHE